MYRVGVIDHGWVPLSSHVPGHKVLACIDLILATRLSMLSLNIDIAVDSKEQPSISPL